MYSIDEPRARLAARWQSLLVAAYRDDPVELRGVLDVAVGQGLVLTRAQVRAAGVDDAHTRRLLYRRSWTNPRRGVVCPLPPVRNGSGRPDDGPGGDSVEIAATAAALLRPGSVISHDSAVALHGLPLLHRSSVPTLTLGRRSQAVSYSFVRVHAAPLLRSEVTSWLGAPVTSVARSIADLARSGGAPAGLVAADAALRAGTTTHRELQQVAARQLGWPGSRATRRVVDLADAGAESALETLTRLCLHDGGLPPPHLQVWISTSGGDYRVDMLFAAARVIVEADGALKYREHPDALLVEKRRQEHLERAGYQVVRVMWDDVVRHPESVVARVGAALARGLRAG